MTAEEFRRIVNEARSEHPIWFDRESDLPASQSQIQDAESSLGARFPQQYVDFLKEFGGGDFVFTEIYSVTSETKSGVVEMNTGAGLPSGFIAFSNDGTGNSYGFKVDSDGMCDQQVSYFDFESSSISSTGKDFYQFVEQEAFHY